MQGCRHMRGCSQQVTVVCDLRLPPASEAVSVASERCGHAPIVPQRLIAGLGNNDVQACPHVASCPACWNSDLDSSPSQVRVNAGSRLPLSEAWWLREVWLPGVEEQQHSPVGTAARQHTGGLTSVPEDAPVESASEPEKLSERNRGAAAVGAALLLLLGLEATHSTLASSMSTGRNSLGSQGAALVARQVQEHSSPEMGPCSTWPQWAQLHALASLAVALLERQQAAEGARSGLQPLSGSCGGHL